jgi:hypothetical protein
MGSELEVQCQWSDNNVRYMQPCSTSGTDDHDSLSPLDDESKKHLCQQVGNTERRKPIFRTP